MSLNKIFILVSTNIKKDLDIRINIPIYSSFPT